MQDSSLITCATFNTAMEAYVLRSKLESEGIVCYVFDEHTVTMNPLYNVTVGGVKLKISARDSEKAKAILNEIEAAPYRDENYEVIQCPKCNSEEIYGSFPTIRNILVLLVMIFSLAFLVYPIYQKYVYRCKRCGTEFTTKKE